MRAAENPSSPPPYASRREARGAREIGPQRFQRRVEAAPKRSFLRAAGAGVVLLALVAGVPAGLFLLAGLPPVPTSWPSREDLTGTIGAEQLVGVLLWIVWLAWLQFTVCVLVEFRSAVRGIGLPSRVPLSGSSQRLARVLVGSVLLAATAVGQASAAVPATPADAGAGGSPSADRFAVADHGVISAAVHESAPPDASPSHDASAPSERAVYRLGDMVLDPSDGKQLLGRKVYVVQPPEGRYHDNLWDIAERTLGDGRRYQEIYQLNRGRTQPDGHELSLARLIYPNWLIALPDDATGVDVVTFEEPEAPEEPAGQSGGPAEQGEPGDGTDGESQGAEGSGAGADTAAGDVPDGQASADDPATEHSPFRDLAYGGLLAAGVLAAIEAVRRRRRTPEPGDQEVEAEVALRIGADSDRAHWLDYALRSLAASCRDSGRPLPSIYAAYVDNESVDLMLAPPRDDAPAPWEVTDEGRRWILERETLVGGAASIPGDVPAPYPGLVSLGRDGDWDILVDLEGAGGPISVVGDPRAAFEVVTAIAVELATNRWSDQLRVTASGLPEELTAFDSQRLRLVGDVAATLPELMSKRTDKLGPDVLSGRLQPGGGAAWMPEYVVLGTGPDEAVADQLVELTRSAGRSALGVVCAGEVPGARWRLSVDSAGTLDVPALGLTFRANQLSWRSIEAIAGLVDPEGAAARGHGPDAPVLHEAWLPEARPDIPEPPAYLGVADLATAPVRVFVLGPVEVQTANAIDDERRALATEIVVYLAVHRDGVHPTVLAAAVWPGGVTASVRESTFARVRDWLGVDPDGSPYLLMMSDGRLKLSDEVVLDWDVVCGLLRQARAARSMKEELDLLRQALRVARGPVLAERPQGRYSWIARARLERLASDVLVDAAHRLSRLCGDGGEPGTAAAAARAGLRVRQSEQLLWRDLLHAQHAVDGPAGVAAAAEEMSTTLSAIGVQGLEPETTALLDELMPGSVAEPRRVRFADPA